MLLTSCSLGAGNGRAPTSPDAASGQTATAPATAPETSSERQPAADPTRPALPDPDKRMLLGTYIDLSDVHGTERAIEQREQAMGRPYDLETVYYDWKDPFPDAGEATIAAHGRTPVMIWFGPGKNPGDPGSLREITSGRADAWITRQARAIKRYGKPVYLVLMSEMNGDWHPGYSQQPKAFVKAWRHIHELFDEAGASNVVWVWCPNALPDDWDRYYPGDRYVDVIGVDAYNTAHNAHWGSFAQLFGPFLKHYAGRKPLTIVETATDSSGGSAAAYISGMHRYLEQVAGPRYGLIALCWFDTDTNGTENWRLDQTPQARHAWLNLARDPYFGGHGKPGGG
jgi:hypothetical protein